MELKSKTKTVVTELLDCVFILFFFFFASTFGKMQAAEKVTDLWPLAT